MSYTLQGYATRLAEIGKFKKGLGQTKSQKSIFWGDPKTVRVVGGPEGLKPIEYPMKDFLEKVFLDKGKPTMAQVEDIVLNTHRYNMDTITADFAAKAELPNDALARLGAYFNLMELNDRAIIRYVPKNRLVRFFGNGGMPEPGKFASLALGSFLKKIFPGQPDAVIEAKVAYAKGLLLANRIVVEEYTDERILWAYDEVNYDKTFNIGRLAHSCMRGKSSQPAIKFYVNNPHCSLLVATRGEGKNKKVVGRTVIWTHDNGERGCSYHYCSDATSVLFSQYMKEHKIHDMNWTFSKLTMTFEKSLMSSSGTYSQALPSLDGLHLSRDGKQILGGRY